MPREDDVCPIADHQVFGDFDIAGGQRVDFTKDRLGIENDTACDNTLDLRAKNAAGNERKFIFFAWSKTTV